MSNTPLPADIAFPAVAAPLVREIAEEALRSVDSLRREVLEYRTTVARESETNAVVDTATAFALTEGCLALLDHLQHDSSTETHMLIQLACRYFVLEEDAEGDLDSSIGFDDDAEVFDVICRYLGRDDLVLEQP